MNYVIETLFEPFSAADELGEGRTLKLAFYHTEELTRDAIIALPYRNHL